MFTGKSLAITVLGRELTFFNQRCEDWTHLYDYEHNGANLCKAGCGVFSLCHGAQWLTGQAQQPEYWGDVSIRVGGRGDDGTDRPAMLHGLMGTGDAAKLGFRYEEDGLRNDLDALYTFLLEEQGVAMCNLRVGHIVTLVAAREAYGRKQVLAIDPHSESADDRVKNHVCEVVPGAEVTYPIRNAAGLPVGTGTAYAAFWVDASIPRDFILMHKL